MATRPHPNQSLRKTPINREDRERAQQAADEYIEQVEEILQELDLEDSRFSPPLQNHTEEIPPDDDVDDYIADCSLHIERLGADEIRLCAYGDEIDTHYYVKQTDNGLKVRRRADLSVTY